LNQKATKYYNVTQSSFPPTDLTSQLNKSVLEFQVQSETQFPMISKNVMKKKKKSSLAKLEKKTSAAKLDEFILKPLRHRSV
jgi:hypothetical protein